MTDNVKISDIKFDRANANKGTERGRYAIEASMREFGFADAGTLDKNNAIIGGNKRTEVAGEIGMDDAIVIDVDGTKPVFIRRNDLDLFSTEDDRARRLAYALNRSQQLSLDWDAEQVLADLNAGVDLSALWKQDELDELLADLQPKTTEGDTEAEIDRAEELRQKWGVEPGQLWQLGEHRLICGDCTDAAVVARVMGGEKAALLLTDPPYGVDYGELVRSRENQKKAGWNDIQNDALDDTQLYNLLVGALSGQGALCGFVWHPAGARRWLFWKAAEENGWRIAQEIVWVKNALVFGRADYQWRHEPCLYLKREGAPRQDDRTQTTVWEVNKPTDSMHPTQKPVDLFMIPIRNHTDMGGIVYEPFSGSGTTLIACENLGRRCRAVEIAPGYVAVALERWHVHTGKTPELIPNETT